MAGTVTLAEAVALRRQEVARISTEDGPTMTLHVGVRRDHHQPSAGRFGPDTGHDIPLRGDFTDPLRPLLQRYGTHSNLVLFTLDETVLSRKPAPLAGFYASLNVGQPWWFLDAPDAIRHWRCAVTETVGITHVRVHRRQPSVLHHPGTARHVSPPRQRPPRGPVAEHRLGEDEALETAVDLVSGCPQEVFKL